MLAGILMTPEKEINTASNGKVQELPLNKMEDACNVYKSQHFLCPIFVLSSYHKKVKFLESPKQQFLLMNFLS